VVAMTGIIEKDHWHPFHVFFLYSWFRASWLYINRIQWDATVCRCLFTV